MRLGDIVTVHEAPDVKYATVVQVLPYAEDLEGVTGETFETFLEPFFSGDFKPVRSIKMMDDTEAVQSVAVLGWLMFAVSVRLAAPVCGCM